MNCKQKLEYGNKQVSYGSSQGGSVRRFSIVKKRRRGTVYCEYRLRHRSAPSTQSYQIIVCFLGIGEYRLRQNYVIGSLVGEHFLRPECSTWLYSLGQQRMISITAHLIQLRRQPFLVDIDQSQAISPHLVTKYREYGSEVEHRSTFHSSFRFSKHSQNVYKTEAAFPGAYCRFVLTTI